jgi:8-oxo-dGTP pyrophosphatase MutT (NUDIX family)
MIKKLSSRIAYENKWMKVREDEVEFSDGSQGIYGIVEKPDFALIIPELSDSYVLVRPYRYSIGEGRWEFPQGNAEEEGLQPEEVARRELAEETGYRAATMVRLASLHTVYGYSTQLMHVFAATGLTAGETSHDQGELGLKINNFSDKEIEKMILDGEMTDAQSIAAWGIYKMRKDS